MAATPKRAEENDPARPLRRGWTTGACATAATRAAYTALVTGKFPDPVSVMLPGGQEPWFPLVVSNRDINHARAAVRKDAGDDPDVTHGALVEAWVRRAPEGAGIVFRAGEGVGIVTKPGLSLGVGEPAINPAPRRMIVEAVQQLAKELAGPMDVSVTIVIPDGRRLAERTMNGRLGIVGGLSVLGTSGIVKPYSCAAWIASIRQGVDVAAASGATHIAAATGRVSEAAAQSLYGLETTAMIDMGDFIGATLKQVRRNPVPRLTIAGGFAKISKFADGHMDLHSDRSAVDKDGLRRRLAELGADGETLAATRAASSAGAILEIATAAELRLGDTIAAEARAQAEGVLDGATPRPAVDVIIVDRAGQIVGRSGP
jgi:cobalt-precorrin-5B (C1)-methyltransferase